MDTRTALAALAAFAALAVALPSFTTNSDAAIPRETELALQAKAPENLHIEILSVKKRRKGAHYKVTAKAKVLKVEKTASAVEAGSEVTLVYTTVAVPMPSAPPGLVNKGTKYSAFLKKSEDGTYDAAAASGTFEAIGKAPAGKPAPAG